MRRHVVRPLVIVLVVFAFRREFVEEFLQIVAHRACGVFLDEQGSRGVTAEQCEQSLGYGLLAHPAAHRVRDLREPAAGRARLENEHGLAHGRRYYELHPPVGNKCTPVLLNKMRTSAVQLALSRPAVDWFPMDVRKGGTLMATLTETDIAESR